jgi:hypothetical protein
VLGINYIGKDNKMRIELKPSSVLELSDVKCEGEALKGKLVFYNRGRESNALVCKVFNDAEELLSTSIIGVWGRTGKPFVKDITKPVHPAAERITNRVKASERKDK